MNKPKDKLTTKQRRFCIAYSGEAKGNGTQAARLAGYKGNDATLSAVASENLQKPLVIQLIRELAEKDERPKILSRAERRALLSEIARGEVTEEWIGTVGIGNGFSEVARVKDKGTSVGDRSKALELLGKMSGDFLDRVEVRGVDWLRGGLEKVRKKIRAGMCKYLTEDGLDELLKAMAEDGV